MRSVSHQVVFGKAAANKKLINKDNNNRVRHKDANDTHFYFIML